VKFSGIPAGTREGVVLRIETGGEGDGDERGKGEEVDDATAEDLGACWRCGTLGVSSSSTSVTKVENEMALPEPRATDFGWSI
jgi:hypothetical protein